MTVTFDKRKNDALSKADKSSIGDWDPKIKGLCDKLNKSDDYYSASSCAGRVVLIKNVLKKGPGLFVLRTHEKIKLAELDKALEDYDGEEGLVYKQESCILHVACRDLDAAKALLRLAQESGWKQSGIISIGSNRVVVDLRSTEIVSFLIYDNGKLLVDEDFLKILVKESNEKLDRTWDKIKRLQKVV